MNRPGQSVAVQNSSAVAAGRPPSEPETGLAGYITANLPRTGLRTGDAIFQALAAITDEDIRAAAAGDRWADWQERLRRGERWPAHIVETARLTAEREARQARRAETEAW